MALISLKKQVDGDTFPRLSHYVVHCEFVLSDLTVNKQSYLRVTKTTKN